MSFYIKDSYRIKGREEMRALIEAHRIMNPNNIALKRKTASLVREWCGHNLLFNLGLFKSHTLSVDFEDYPSVITTIVWFILQLFYFK